MYKKKFAFFPTALLQPKTQKDLASIYLTLQLMMETVVLRDSPVAGQFLDTIETLLESGITKSYAYLSIDYLDVFETEAEECWDRLLHCNLSSQFINKYLEEVKIDTCAELKADDRQIKVSNLFFKENFRDFYKFPGSGTIPAIKSVTVQDITYWFSKIQSSNFFCLDSNNQVQVKTMKAASILQDYKLQLNNPKLKHGVPYYTVEDLYQHDSKLIAFVNSVSEDWTKIFALEKYLRDELKLIIDVSRCILPGTCIVKVFIYEKLDAKETFKQVQEREGKIIEKVKYFYKNLEAELKVKQCLDFGQKKYQALKASSNTFKIKEVWESILFNSTQIKT